MIKFSELDVGVDTPILKNLNGKVDANLTFLIGPNGSGKTSFLKTLCQIIEPLAGRIDSPDSAIFLTTEPQIQDGITGRDLLDLYQTKNSKWGQTTLLEFFNAEKLLNFPIDALSSGERQRVLLCAVLLNKSNWVLMDEPLTHLDWNYSLKLRRVMSDQIKLGRNFLISNHDLNWSLGFLESGVQSQTWVLHKQSIFLKGSTETIMSDIKLQDVFSVKLEVSDSKKKLISFSEL